MKAEEFVGKWIVSEVLTDEINAPAGTRFKVQGSRVCPEYEFGNSRRRALGLERINAGQCHNQGVRNL